MEFFSHFVSNTLAGSGNQAFFLRDDVDAVQTCRTYYKVFHGGKLPYSFLFSNITDSTFGDGTKSHRNLVLDSWSISAARVGVCTECGPTQATEPPTLLPLTFGGCAEKNVAPGEFFATDPVRLDAPAGGYVCLELCFKGRQIPSHNESILPSFVRKEGKWLPSIYHPFASMIGVTRSVKHRIAFLGDSITQGIGTENNSYTHWNAVAAQKLGDRHAYWNLGLGYARADDAATDGAWLYKVKQNDIAVVCLGVNDICQGFTADTLKRNLQTIVDTLYKAGVKVILQTVPPFDYPEARKQIWLDVNDFILNECRNVALTFDNIPYLSESSASPEKAKYGGHPNAEGCYIWGSALADAIAQSGILE